MATVTFTPAELQALAKLVAPLILPPASTPPVVTPPPVGVSWVYTGGKFVWGLDGGGDYSWDASINYADVAGAPAVGLADIAVTILNRWGGFQPYAPGKQFDTSPYRYLIYSAKPTVANQVFGHGFAAINDVADGVAVNIGAQFGIPYGPVPQVGVWGHYKIPLADFKLTNPVIQKFTIADGSGLTSNTYYLDDIGFLP